MNVMMNDPHFDYLAYAYGFAALCLLWMVASSLMGWRRARRAAEVEDA